MRSRRIGICGAYAWVAEREVLFPTLTGLELLSHHIDGDGDRLVVNVRPSINHNSLTIEKVLAKMQTSHLSLLDLLTDNLRFAGVPQMMLQPLKNLKTHAQQREPSWFNSTHNYDSATTQALQMQREVFKAIVANGDDTRRLWAEISSEKLKDVAELAARAGEHEIAVELLLTWRRRQHASEGRAWTR